MYEASSNNNLLLIIIIIIIIIIILLLWKWDTLKTGRKMVEESRP